MRVDIARVAGALTATTVLAEPAIAQQSGAAVNLDAIVVTAERTDRSLQDTASCVVVRTATDLQESGSQTIHDT